MFAALLALSLGAALQASAARVAPPAPTKIVLLGPPQRVETEELKRLRAELPKAARSAKLLNSSEIADAMDYPADAVAKGQQGTVGTWLLVGEDGRVQRCGIELSSGSATLDSQTCDLFTVNGRFEPATDRRGNHIRGLYHQQIVWRLQEGVKVKILNQIDRQSFILSPDGHLRECKSELRVRAGEWVAMPKDRCADFAEKSAALLRLVRGKSKLHDAHAVLEARVFVDPAEAMPPVANDPGDVLIYLRRATMHFDPSGKRTSCSIEESSGDPGLGTDPCLNSALDRLPPGATEAGKAPGSVQFLWAIYLKNEKT